GIDPEKDFTKQQLTQPEGVMALKDGNVDAVFWNFAAPGSAVLEVAAQREVVMIPLEEDLVNKIIEVNPFLIPYTIKTGVYESIKEDIRTIADGNYLVVRDDMDETLSYNLVKTIIENRDKFMNITTQAEHFTPEEASVGITEFVSGANKYFIEQGIDMK
ncbi:MAG: TAXI family TRAP transporter solute-binding subunit, partial [Synergistota bacterium]|nr:TAXI family TRAP transporter solute-binding subunit [Synergistota bacterium]